ncbi:DNA-directed RNA polymerase III complex subunit Rpc37 [Ceratocystis lukuohia]|uniref:DNA-directed RNA polymerase III subunit rpc5 n=2 Tax=Ceratocystis TaxID=5157 RepID=A0A0F8DIJ9_CERFI|nr:DNA-directed RNA polymerase III subunit rpc5 [Ceratocystis platani]
MSPNHEDDDPIVSTFDVFINPALPPNQQLLVLQQLNRRGPDARPFEAPPHEMRIKGNTGMVEVDLPLNTMDGYDRDRGMQYGKVLSESMAAKGGGSHGLAGGFGVGAPPTRPGGPGRRKEDLMRSGGDWADEARQGRVLHMQTLGGQEPNAKPVTYMVGAFHEDELHFTPVNSFIHLRPQLHHVDALSQLDKATAQSSAKEAAGASASANGAAGAGAGAGRAIHMTVKTAGEGGDAIVTETMTDRLRAVQAERWRKLAYTDENFDEAWDAYEETLLPLRNGINAPPSAEAGDDKEKLKKIKPDPVNKLSNTFRELETRWDDVRLLEAVSGSKRPNAVAESLNNSKIKSEAKGKQVAFDAVSHKGMSGATAMVLD